jgi:hemoglobin
MGMPSARVDIEDRDDCERLVRAFYTRALSDPVIGFIFTDVAHLDLEAHVPRITSFWETILLGAQSYSGGAFRPHVIINAQVPLLRGHFERWLWLWSATVDELFAGPRAELAKAHATRVPAAFHGRLEAMTASAAGASDLSAIPISDADTPFTIVHSGSEGARDTPRASLARPDLRQRAVKRG